VFFKAFIALFKGIATVQGRTETAEKLDVKVSLFCSINTPVLEDKTALHS
jgi:hypothetical protein